MRRRTSSSPSDPRRPGSTSSIGASCSPLPRRSSAPWKRASRKSTLLRWRCRPTARQVRSPRTRQEHPAGDSRDRDDRGRRRRFRYRAILAQRAQARVRAILRPSQVRMVERPLARPGQGARRHAAAALRDPVRPAHRRRRRRAARASGWIGGPARGRQRADFRVVRERARKGRRGRALCLAAQPRRADGHHDARCAEGRPAADQHRGLRAAGLRLARAPAMEHRPGAAACGQRDPLQATVDLGRASRRRGRIRDGRRHSSRPR